MYVMYLSNIICAVYTFYIIKYLSVLTSDRIYVTSLDLFEKPYLIGL